MKTRLRVCVVLALAGWTYPTSALDFSTNVTGTDGVAAGRDIRDSTIIVGVPAEKLEALIRDRTKLLEELVASHTDTIARLKKALDINERQIGTALNILGENDVPPEHLAAKLVEIAERFKALQAAGPPQAGDTPEVANLRQQANKAIEDGNLTTGDALLARIEQVQQAGLASQQTVLDQRGLDLANTLARRGEVALARLRYLEAAKHFAAAAVQIPQGHDEQRLANLDKEAVTLYRQGHEFGDNAALAAAIQRYGTLLTLRSRDRVPLDWAKTQNKLGIVLAALGERESSTAHLEEAVTAYRAALDEWTRERVPLLWATSQNNLGNALLKLGERESGTARLEEAVTAYRAALKEWTRERVPLLWATNQNSLGSALRSLGERESGTARLEEAVATFRAALEEQTRDRAPLDWAKTKNNLGVVLAALGDRASGTARLEEAVVAFRAALEELTPERVPLDWAATENNLGTVLKTLGERESDTARLEQAVAAFHATLRVFIRERAPLRWAMTQDNLGGALAALGERESGTAHLEEAVVVYSAALEEYTRERVPLQWAMTTGKQGVSLMMLAKRRGDARIAQTAASQIESALATTNDGSHEPSARYFAARLPEALALVDRLAKR
jgi:tetratricopeptide (TPR) repeat protein